MTSDWIKVEDGLKMLSVDQISQQGPTVRQKADNDEQQGAKKRSVHSTHDLQRPQCVEKLGDDVFRGLPHAAVGFWV